MYSRARIIPSSFSRWIRENALLYSVEDHRDSESNQDSTETRLDMSASQPLLTVEDDNKYTTPKPWIDAVRGLLLETGLPPRSINSILKGWIPQKHHHALTLLDEDTPDRTFHQFQQLPAELRIAIWELAATHTRKIVDWPNRLKLLPLKAKPPAAWACKEAFDIIAPTGGYYEPPPIYRVRHPKPYGWLGSKSWVSLHDLILTWDLPVLHEPTMDAIRRRKEIGIYNHRFCRYAGYATNKSIGYAWLLEARELEALIVVICWQKVRIAENSGKQPSTSSDPFFRPLVSKLFMLDDPDDVERAKLLWHGIDPALGWMWKDPNGGSFERPVCNEACGTPRQAFYDWVGDKILDWRGGEEATIKAAWIRLMACTDPQRRYDADIFTDWSRDSKLNMENLWVQETLAKMPVLRPAVMLEILPSRWEPEWNELVQ